MKFDNLASVLTALLLRMFPLCFAFTEDDVKECGTSIFSRVNCSSVSFYYRECPIPGADDVTKIKLSRNLSQKPCQFDVTFGFRADVVWVTGGCSGEFYVCYEGVLPSTTKEPVVSTVEITKESTEDSTNNATLYIIIAVTLAVLALIGLIAGCLVKRRQSNEKSKKLAEKRQMSLEAHENKIDDDVRITPIIKQPSMESLYFPEGSVDLDKYEKASNASTRSSTSGFASVSSRATGRCMTSRRAGPGWALSLDPTELRRGRSAPDISGQRTKYNQNYKGSQTSLNSILELHVQSSEKSEGQTSEKRRYIPKTSKYNTVGFRGNCVDNLYNSKRSGQTLPIKRTQTRALVHTRRPGQDSEISNLTTAIGDTNMQFRPQYLDPQSLLASHNQNTNNSIQNLNTDIAIQKLNTDTTLQTLNTERSLENLNTNPIENTAEDNELGFRPVDPPNSISDNIYSTVKKPKKPRPMVAPKPRKDIYTCPNSDRVAQRSDSLASDSSLEENNNQHLTDVLACNESFDSDRSKDQTQHYALMHTFKPTKIYESIDVLSEPNHTCQSPSVTPAQF